MKSKIVARRNNSYLITSIRITLLVMILYFGWFQKVFYSFFMGSQLIGLALLLLIVIHSIKFQTNLNATITIELKVWLIFFVYSLVSSAIISDSLYYSLNALFTFFQYLVMMFCISYISQFDDSIDYSIKLIILLSLVLSLSVFFTPTQYTTLRVSVSEEYNPNALGITLVYGIIFLFFKFRNNLAVVMKSFLSLFFLYSLLLSGSRKSLLSLVLFFLTNLFMKTLSTIKQGKISFTYITKTMFNGMLLFFGYTVITRIADDFFSGMSTRMERLSFETVRVDMFKEGFALFVDSPFFGIGFNNFRVVSRFGTYSHSTFSEIFSCTGIVGAVLYFLPYFLILSKLFGILKKTANGNIRNNAILFISLFLVLISLGFSIIHFYDLITFYAISLIVSFNMISLKNIETKYTK